MIFEHTYCAIINIMILHQHLEIEQYFLSTTDIYAIMVCLIELGQILWLNTFLGLMGPRGLQTFPREARNN